MSIILEEVRRTRLRGLARFSQVDEPHNCASSRESKVPSNCCDRARVEMREVPR